MRLIGMLLVLLFALRPQLAEGRPQVQTSCAYTCIEARGLVGSLWASTSAGHGDEAV